MSPDAPTSSAQTTLQEFRRISARLGFSAWPPAHVVGLGLLVALVDALAVALVVALLFALLGQRPSGEAMGRLMQVVDALTGGHWPMLALLVLGLVVVKAGVGHAYALFTIRFKNDINARVLQAGHARLIDMPYSELRARGQGDLLNAAASETWQVANAAYILTRLAVKLCTIVVFAVVIVTLSWRIALLAAVGAAVIALAGRLIGRAARATGVKVRAGIEAFYTRVLTALHGARVVRVFTAESAEKARVADELQRLRADVFRAEAIQAASGPLNEIGYVALLIVLIGLAAAFGVDQATSLVAVALLYRMAPQIKEVESGRLTFAGLYAPLRSVAALLAPGAETPSSRGGAFDSQVRPIRFEGVTFAPARGGDPALSNASFELPAGRVTALLGPSGAGKTSVVSLVLRLYEPDAGVIRVGDTPLSEIDRNSWLSGVAAAGQDLDLVEGTISENIAIGAPGASEEEIRNAARDAGALGFIEAAPAGFATWVGAFGYALSGGERQRISLARAFLRKPTLLILDEATSAVESDLEAQILQNIARRCAGVTVVMVTHRLNRAAKVDHVVRLENGEVVAEHPFTPAHPLSVNEERRA